MINEEILDAVVSEKIICFKNHTECYSKTRDVFLARLQRYIMETGEYLKAAIIGEIGNNTFDHNMVYEKNYPWGVFCNFTYKGNYIVLADYGKGVRQSLLSVIPSLGSDLEAVIIAFTKKISGRSPEQRGNGLKFVSETIKKNKWHLYFQSGTGSCSIDSRGINFTEKPVLLAGCLAILNFDKDPS